MLSYVSYVLKHWSQCHETFSTKAFIYFLSQIFINLRKERSAEISSKFEYTIFSCDGRIIYNNSSAKRPIWPHRTLNHNTIINETV